MEDGLYPYSEAKDSILPVVKKGEKLKIQDLNLEEKQTQPPSRYSQSKLIQVMEELGLGTKSTRHEVIQKLISRKYIEGNPLRPTLVGKAVTESLEAHASTITRPDMTQKLEQAMEAIKVRNKSRDGVVDDSRKMLHQVFDELEPNEAVIGQEIMGQTDEELTIGPCPVCGKDLRIRRKGGSQFIGCNGYPDCTCNISLPGTMWGSAVRTKKVCEVHNLFHVSLIAKGARPWDMGCPLCQLIEQQKEHYAKMPAMTEALQQKLLDAKIFSLYELSKFEPAVLTKKLGITKKQAETLIHEANDVLDLIRRRSECKKFMKQFVPPKRGRSHTKVMNGFTESGIDCIGDIASATIESLKKTGLSEEEAKTLKTEAISLVAKNQLKDIGIPAVSLKRYQEAGFLTPEDIASAHPAYLAFKTGISIETVGKHATLITQSLGKPDPVKISKKAFESGKIELTSLPGVGESTLEHLYRAGIFDKKSLISADPAKVAKSGGLSKDHLKKLQAAAVV
jgi:DNA topoisomerase-1